MSRTIPQELSTFKTTVSSGLASMNSKLTEISSKVTEIMQANESAKNGIDQYYNSTNKDSILSSFTNLNNIYNKISTSLTSDLKKMLDDSQKVIEKVEELETLVSEISAKESEISSEYNKETPSYSAISDARSVINSKESEFDRISNEATTLLNNLKSMDASLSFTSEFSASEYDYNQLASIQTGGEIKEYVFEASNGVKMRYYVYIPTFADGTTENLPLLLYLHGDSGAEGRSGVFCSSLPMLLKNGTVQVPGIVVMPQSDTAVWWDDSKGADKNREAAVELTRKIASDYNCDMSRISAAGFSNGGCGVFHMVRDHTDLFSCYVAAAGATGKSANNEKIAQDKVYTWVIHGDRDTTVTYDNANGVSGKETYERIEAVWPEGTSFTPLKGRDHNIMNDMWDAKLEKDGELISPIEWLLSTKKYGT